MAKSRRQPPKPSSKIKILRVRKTAPGIHLVTLEIEAKGGGDPPAMITPEQAVEISPNDPNPQLAATVEWVKWLKSIW
jgi:hypothetical protein